MKIVPFSAGNANIPGLGQGTIGPSHGSVSVSLPWQLIGSTPVRVAGGKHRLVRRLVPVGPQLTEQGPSSDQHVHWPTHGPLLHGREACPAPEQSPPEPITVTLPSIYNSYDVRSLWHNVSFAHLFVRLFVCHKYIVAKGCEIEPRLLLITNKKSHINFQMT